MESTHRHPAYEETLARVATILDVIAQEQLEQQHAMKRLERVLEEYIEHGKIRDSETTDKLDGLIQLMDRHVREHDKK